jgi:predicted dehydrogenase
MQCCGPKLRDKQASPAPSSVTRPLRVAVVGVGHYHAAYAPYYLDLLKQHGAEIGGLADPDRAVARARAARFGGAAFADYRRMLAETRPDFVLALGRHIDMPEAFRYLVEAGVPFLAEKPWGVDAATVRDLAALAEAKGAWVATPFSMRYSTWAETARRMLRDGSAGAVSHITFRMIRPGVARYVDQGCEWMLRRREAGGGVLLNLGVHGFDLCRWLTGEEPEIVSSMISSAVFGLEIEDYAAVTLRTPSGIVFHVEVGYTYPAASGADDERKLAASNVLLIEAGDGVRIVTADRDEVVPAPAGYVSGWAGVVADCLGRVARGDPPPNVPHDTARAVSLVFEAYERAGRA